MTSNVFIMNYHHQVKSMLEELSQKGITLDSKMSGEQIRTIYNALLICMGLPKVSSQLELFENAK